MVRARPVEGLVDAIAPASPFDRAAFDGGLALLLARGFEVRCSPDIGERDRFLAGSDARRLDELNAAIDAPDSSLIWCARGGYGCNRLLPSLSIDRIRRANKLLVGFSDITALHARWRVAGVTSVHGSMLARLVKKPPDVMDRLLSMLRRGVVAPPLQGRTLVPGTAEGVVAGSNLALFASLCGTPYQPDLTGAIVLLEDVGEPSFRIDRMLTQCTQAGLFRGIAGLAFGEFFQCGDSGAPVDGVLAEHAQRLGVPALCDLSFGHGAMNQGVPLGIRGRFGADARLEFLEPLT